MFYLVERNRDKNDIRNELDKKIAKSAHHNKNKIKKENNKRPVKRLSGERECYYSVIFRSFPAKFN